MDTKTNVTVPEYSASNHLKNMSGKPSLLALLFGMIAGILIHYTQSDQLLQIRDLLEPLGYLWLSALRMIVFPLVVSSLVVAVLNSSKFNSAGRVGTAALGAFVLVLCSGAVFSVVIGSALLELLPDTASMTIPPVSESAQQLLADRKPLSLGDWLNSLIPTNPFAALAEGHLLPVIIFTVAFSIALNHVEGPGRQIVQQFFQAIFDAMMTVVRWILVVAPAAIFILAMSFASSMGVDFTTILLSYLVMICGLLVLFTLLLYPMTCAVAGISLRKFAAGVFPAQSVALSTRSSLASLPALLEGATDILRLNPAVANLVLPLAVSVFKTNRTISSTFSLLVLGHLFGLDLGAAEILTFIITSMVLSFSAVGIPMGGNTMMLLPAYIAAGVPIEGYLLLKTVNPVSDVPKTLVNVTGDLSVATILNRFFGGKRANTE